MDKIIYVLTSTNSIGRTVIQRCYTNEKKALVKAADMNQFNAEMLAGDPDGISVTFQVLRVPLED